MIVVVPPAAAVNSPEEIPIVAAAGLELLHVPPGVASLIVAVVPVHITVGPVIGVIGCTVITAAAKHPPVNV